MPANIQSAFPALTSQKSDTKGPKTHYAACFNVMAELRRYREKVNRFNDKSDIFRKSKQSHQQPLNGKHY